MKPELKELVEELQEAFNESVCGSDRIAEVLAEIKASGYEVVLALDVTIGVTPAVPEHAEPTASPAAAHEFSLSAEDRLFLEGMHISAG
ncbi:MAG TPA: hypothetical protein VKX49_24785 [Bryobacteraceae bacterium]|nr:hypothetical protein [Bryobacteraceae bacterium]